MDLKIHTLDTAPTGSRELLEGIKGELGFVPNLAASVAESPALLAGFDGLRRAVHSGELPAADREIAGVAVGVAVDNAYGVAFHSTVLAGLGVDDAEIERMRSGSEPSDPHGAAVYALAREIVVSRGKADPATIARAIAAGLTPALVLEIVAECTFAGLVGVVDNLADRVELDEPFIPRAWT
ncbi:MAG TPA: carboxymuconolactone decarboxylase family protein [Acidimicrobiales bacterium]|nr:carboxymuconolactone decarboxylase family protein [Acidimicrobiales bacterium]